jgi:hypothetical protein
MSGASSSRSAIAALLEDEPQVLDVDAVLLPADRLLHPDQGREGYEPDRQIPVQRLDQRAAVFGFEVKRLVDERVDRGLGMLITPKLQHLHPLVADPACPRRFVGELLGGDGDVRPVAELSQCGECAQHVGGDELEDQVDVLGEAQEAVGVHGESSDDQIAYILPARGSHDGLDARKSHDATIGPAPRVDKPGDVAAWAGGVAGYSVAGRQALIC